MKKFTVLTLAMILVVTLCSCGKSWVCDRCGEEFSGTAYYGMNYDDTFCEDCARSYWMPLPYQNYTKK